MVKRLLVANIIEEGRWGGPQQRITMVARELHGHGIDTVVLLPTANSEKFQRKLRESQVLFEVLRLQQLNRSLFNAICYIVSFVADVRKLTCALRQRHYDLVHVSGGALQIKGALAGRLAGVPVVWHLNDTGGRMLLVWLFRRLATTLASAFILTAERSRHVYLSSLKPRRWPIYVIQAPVDTRKFDPLIAKPDGKIAAYPGLKVLSVCNINPTKGLEDFINAAGILFKGGVEYSFLIVGPVYGTQRHYFMRLQQLIVRLDIAEHVHFLGSSENIARVMSAADIFVCSSLAESGPMTLWEAMAMQKAIVSTDVGDVARYVTSGSTGFVVPVGNPKALADAISKLAIDPDLRWNIGRLARETVKREMELEVIAMRTAAYYRQIVEHTERVHLSRKAFKDVAI